MNGALTASHTTRSSCLMSSFNMVTVLLYFTYVPIIIRVRSHSLQYSIQHIFHFASFGYLLDIEIQVDFFGTHFSHTGALCLR